MRNRPRAKRVVVIAFIVGFLYCAAPVAIAAAEDAQSVIETAPPAACTAVNPLAPPICTEWASTQERPGKPY